MWYAVTALALGVIAWLITRFVLGGGQRIVKEQLARLGSEYTIVKDVSIPVEDATEDAIDYLIVSLYGIFVVEIQNRKGTIRGEEPDKQWVQVVGKRERSFDNPARENLLRIRALRKLLAGFEHVPIYPAVAFHNKARLDELIVESAAMRYVQLASYIKGFQEKHLNQEEVQRICEILEATSS